MFYVSKIDFIFYVEQRDADCMTYKLGKNIYIKDMFENEKDDLLKFLV